VLERYLPQRTYKLVVGAVASHSSEAAARSATAASDDRCAALPLAIQAADGDHGKIQSGMYVWGAAPALCDWLVCHWRAVARRARDSARARAGDAPSPTARILELGAGVAVCGTCVAALVARDVFGAVECDVELVVTDRDENALALARQNVAEHAARFASTTAHPPPPPLRVDCTSLDWGADGKRTLDALGAFDLIIGSDLLYEHDAMRALFFSVHHALAANAHARFYLCTSLRLSKDDATIALIDGACAQDGMRRRALRDDVDAGGVLIEEFERAL
jgi:hypothetical protein